MGLRALARRRVAPGLLALTAASGCGGRDDPSDRVPLEQTPRQIPRGEYVQAGDVPGRFLPSATVNPFRGDLEAAGEGERLYAEYNCAGCHGGGGKGGMGPSLADSRWRYGGSDAAIFQSIYEGRPLGMPMWGEKLPAEQIWQLVAYLRSLETPDMRTITWPSPSSSRSSEQPQ